MGVLKGHQWQPREIAGWCYDAGWQDAEVLVVAVAVCLAESQGYDHALNVNTDGSQDRGIWQLSTVHKNITDEIAYDPIAATDEAFHLYVSRGSSFDDWVAYTKRICFRDSYLGRSVMGVGNMLGERLLAADVGPLDDGTPYEHSFTTPILNFQFRVVEPLTHVQRAAKILGWEAASKAKVAEVRGELSRAQVVVKNTLPGR